MSRAGPAAHPDYGSENGAVSGSAERPATLILGAGVAGLATAWKLGDLRVAPVIVLERGTQPGGLAGSVDLDGMRLDIGSHRVHPSYFPEALALLRELLGDDLLEVPRRGRLRLNGGYVDYPPTLIDFLGALGPVEIARCAVALVAARVRRCPVARSYEDYLLPRVGRRAYDLFYAPYARKLFGLPPDQVSVTAARTRITTGRPLAVAARILARRRAGVRSDVFYYPANGFGSIADALLAAARAHGVELRTGATVQRVQTDGRRVRAVVFAVDGAPATLPAETVVSTLPLDLLVGLVEPAPPARVQAAAAGLRWRGIRLLQVVLARTRCLDGETYYFPEERYCFGRISEPPQFSPRLRSRPDRTALNIEVICSPGDALWACDEAAFFDRVLHDVGTIGLFDPGDVVAHRSIRVPAVYPVYDLAYREHLTEVLGWADSFENLYTIGRGGMFLHGNTDHSIHLGLRLAAHLADPAAGARDRHRALPPEEFRVRD